MTTLTWLGQAGFLIEPVGGHPLLVDPWLSPHPDRAIPAPDVVLTTFFESAAVLATHGHGDHLDLELICELARAEALSAVVVPTPHADRVLTATPGVDVRGVQPGDSLVLGGTRVSVVRAWHGRTVSDGYTDGLTLTPAGTPHVGYVVDAGDCRIYHAGDSLASPELAAEVALLRPDVVVAPINGRDAEREKRGIVGNMTMTEALALASSVHARVLVPCHYDAVTGNTAKPLPLPPTAAHSAHPVVLVPSRAHSFQLAARRT